MMAGGRGGGGGPMNPNTKTFLIIAAVIAAIAVVMYLDIGGLGTMYKSALGMGTTLPTQ
jgi:hypothetical protein